MHRLQLLGSATLIDGTSGSPVRLWRPDVALLAFVAASPTLSVSRARLAATLWPESGEGAARRCLRQSLHRLRRALGSAIEADGESVALRSGLIEADVWEFEQLLDQERAADAARLYRGSFLDGFHLPGSTSFAQWADAERLRLEKRMVAACRELAEHASERADWRVALEWAERWAELVPCSELAHVRLIATHAQLDDRGRAVELAENFAARLRNELGVEPGAAFAAIVERVRESHAPLRSAHPPPRNEPNPGAHELPMVGREDEFARLTERWRRSETSGRQFVLLAGEPGIGKTRLATEFSRRLRLDGATVLQTRAYEIERGIPYAALAGLLRAALDAPGLAAVDASSLAEISRIVPEIGERFRSGVPVPAADLHLGRIRLLDAARTLLENLAFEAPLLVFIDDLPWSDEATLATLHYVWRHLASYPITVLATARIDDLAVDSAAGRLLGAVGRESPGEFERVELSPLSRAGIVRLLEHIGLDIDSGETLPAVLEERSGGNPLFLIETLRVSSDAAGAPGATETVRAAVTDRLSRLSGDARTMLQAAAVVGRRFPLPLAAAVANVAPERAAAAFEELLGRRLVQQVGYAYDFLHDLVRETVYAELAEPRRTLLHRRVFERMAPDARTGEIGLETAGALALHAELGGTPAAAYSWSLEAAERARAVFAGEEAEGFLRRAARVAVTEEQRREVWVRLGELAHARSQFVSAALAFRAALERAPSGTPERLGLRIRTFDVSLRAGLLDFADAAPAFEELLADALAAGPGFLRDVQLAAAAALLAADRAAEAETYALAAVVAARAAGEPGPLVRALLARARAGSFGTQLAEVLPALDEALGTAVEHGLIFERLDVEVDRATELCRLGRWDDAIAAWEAALDGAVADGDVGSEGVACLNLSDVLLRRGAWEAAEARVDRAATIGERFGFPHVVVNAVVNRALLTWYRDDERNAVGAARQAVTAAVGERIAPAERTARALLALTLLELGRADEAAWELAALDAMPAVRHPIWADDRELVALARARAHLHAGETAAADAVLVAAEAESLDPYGAAVLKRERAALATDVREARRLAGEARSALALLGACPPPPGRVPHDAARADAAVPVREPDGEGACTGTAPA